MKMRFAVATDDQSTLAQHTGRCHYFAIFEVQDDHAYMVDLRPNGFTSHAQGNCGTEVHTHSHETLVQALSDCQALLCRGMGRRLVDDLIAHKIQPIISEEASIDKAAQLFTHNQLPHSIESACSHPD